MATGRARSRYLESEPEDDDEQSDDCASEGSDDRAMIDDTPVEQGINHAAIHHAVIQEDSSEEEAPDDEDSDAEKDRAFRELRNITGKMVRGHRPSEQDLREAGYFCGFGVREEKRKSPKEVAAGIDRALQQAREHARVMQMVRANKQKQAAKQGAPATCPAQVLVSVNPQASAHPKEDSSTSADPEIRFPFMDRMDACVRTNNLQRNMKETSKLLDRERELHRRRLTAKPRTGVKAPKAIPVIKGVPTIDSFFKRGVV
eukprot:766114-Hanusia_phi.AAC.9